jgi:DNA primase
MSSIDEIKARIDILDLVSESVQLRRSGKNYVGFCPFHPNSRTPAFVVFPESGTWRCFGTCNEGGDIFRYVMKKEGWDFPEALRRLAEKAGVVLQPLTPERQAEAEEHERLFTLLEESITFFRYHLTQMPAGKPALAYLEKRGLKAETMERFGLGYAPESWDTLLKHFTQKGYTQDELVQVGLVTERDSGGVYDRFRNRIIIPIRDMAGKPVGFGARILNPEDQPKFLNSPQTVLFDKGRLLYGLDAARKAIRAQDQVVIVEGYLDVITLHQAGFENVVSPMGTALTEDQLRLLKRVTHRMVMALDPDAAGQRATLRGLEIARQAMDHTTELVFDARGLMRQEGRLQADIRVTTLPEGEDPDEIVLRDPQEWTRIVADAKPVVIHVMETLTKGQNLDDPKVKSQVAAQILPLIGDVSNPIEREDYRQRLARLLRIDERALSLPGASAPPPRTARRRSEQRREAVKPAQKPFEAGRPVRAMEEHILQLLLRQPEALYLLDRQLQKAGLLRFSTQDFEQADHQVLARLAQQALEQDTLEANQYLLENLPETLSELVRRYLEPLSGGEPAAQELLEDLVYTLLRLRLVRVNENLDQLRYLQQELESGDLLQENYSEVTAQYILLRQRLDKTLRMPVHLD